MYSANPPPLTARTTTDSAPFRDPHLLLAPRGVDVKEARVHHLMDNNTKTMHIILPAYPLPLAWRLGTTHERMLALVLCLLSQVFRVGSFRNNCENVREPVGLPTGPLHDLSHDKRKAHPTLLFLLA
jgi:hypothetical protein